jgi:hypothetical protein
LPILIFFHAYAFWHSMCSLSGMSQTSKSPKAVAAAAYRIARDTLPEHFSRYSPKKFTQPQLMVCLVLKVFFNTDYRGIVQILDDCRDLGKSFGLQAVPHFTTLQKASRRLLTTANAEKLLQRSVKTGLGRRKTVTLAALDSTGLEARHISRYFVLRKRSKQLQMLEETTYKRFPKLAVICDCRTHLILSVVTTRGPSVDVNQFRRPLDRAARHVPIRHLLADAGYDSEANHTYARETHHIQTTIPARAGRPTGKLPKTKYRRRMATTLDKKKYGQRAQVETVFSMIKRNFTDCLSARSYWPQCRDMVLLALTHNFAIILLVVELFYRACLTPFSPRSADWVGRGGVLCREAMNSIKTLSIGMMTSYGIGPGRKNLDNPLQSFCR